MSIMRGPKHGFTIIEMLVVMVVLSVLASVALPLAEMESRRSREVELRRALWEIRDALDAYKHAYDDGRIQRQLGASGYPSDLATLVEGVRDAQQPDGLTYFLRRIPRDPMRPDVAPESAWGIRAYKSAPDEPKVGDDVYDVYSLSNGVGLDGRKYSKW